MDAPRSRCAFSTDEANNVLDKTIEYVYNGIGNIESVTTYSHINGVPSTNGTTVTLSYDTTHPDRLTSFGSKEITYNSIGYPTNYNGKTLDWTRGKISKVSYGTVTTGTHSYNYDYNALGQRVEKSYSYMPPKNSSSGGIGEVLVAHVTTGNTKYFYDHSGRLVAEYCVQNYSDFTQTSTRLEYLYDESGMIGFKYNASGLDRGAYYFQRNLQGDVVAIYNANGAIKVEYKYDAYGNCSIASSTTDYALALDNPIRYRGYYLDTETGLYYLNARYYSPEWRRFISPDDTAYLAPENVNGLNLYCYCNNDPVNYADPSGHESKWWAWLLSGVAIGVGIVLSATGVGGILGGILIGAGAGSLINGYVTEANGGSFVAGYIGGTISGVLCGVGAGLAGNFFLNATLTSNLAALGWFGASLVTSFAVGFTGNMLGTLVTVGIDKQRVNLMDVVTSSITMGGLNMFAGIGSGMSSAIANMGKVVGLDANSQLAYRLLAGTVAGGTEAFYDITSYLYGFIN